VARHRILDPNGWHNVVHLATGALGLLAFAGGASAARAQRSASARSTSQVRWGDDRPGAPKKVTLR
jgi:hypothetical protein